MTTCHGCGKENPLEARFCMECGSRLARVSDGLEVRKTVTVLFSDIVGYTALSERADAEAVRHTLRRYFDEMREIIHRRGGHIEKFIGDAVMAVFGIPIMQEDDALRAVRAAAEIEGLERSLSQELEASLGLSLEIRTGINTGEVVANEASEGYTFVTGEVVNVAARLEEMAPGGQVLLGESTYRLVRHAVRVQPLGALPIRGKSTAVSAYRLMGLSSDDHVELSPVSFVSRTRELEELESIFDDARQGKRCRLVTLIGPAGVGKSRLAAEFIARLGSEAVSFTGRCLPYGEGSTYGPVGQILKQAAGLHDEDAPIEVLSKVGSILEGQPDARLIADRLVQMIGLTSVHARSEEILWGARRFFESLGGDRPAVVIIEDLHWAEATFLDLIDHLSKYCAGPVMVLALARPEFLEARPDLDGFRVELEPLSTSDTELLISQLLEGGEVDHDVLIRIVESGAGNPLFVEEMVSMLIDDGTLRRIGPTWSPTRDLSEVAIPLTIQALLGARLDRLERDTCRVLERASVIGERFTRRSLSELLKLEMLEHLDEHLSNLERKQLIKQVGPSEDTNSYAFHHILVRDAAYQRLPKRIRGQLHERFALWLELSAGVRLGEYEETVGYHLEQGFEYKRELGLVDERARDLAGVASRRLASAGRRSFAQGDLSAAEKLLARGAALVHAEDPVRVELLLEVARVQKALGRLQGALERLSEVADRASETGDRSLSARAAVEDLGIRLLTEPPDVWKRTARREAERSIQIFEVSGDELGLAHAHETLAESYWFECSFGEAERLLEKALYHARRTGDKLIVANQLTHLGSAKIWSPTPVEEGIKWCESVFDGLEDNRWLGANRLLWMAALRGMSGEFDLARRGIDEALVLINELKLVEVLLYAQETKAFVEMLAGQFDVALEKAREGYELSKETEEAYLQGQFATYAAEAACGARLFEQAEEWITTAESFDPNESDGAILESLRAHVAASKGQFREAEEHARASLTVLHSRENWLDRGRALVSLAEALILQGRREEARANVEEAVALYEAKGVSVLAERAKRVLEITAPRKGAASPSLN